MHFTPWKFKSEGKDGWRESELHGTIFIMTTDQISYSEIRKHPRLDKKIKGDYRIILPEKGEERFPFETETISGGGLMFTSSHPIKEGAHLEFRLFLGDQPIKFTARAVWTQERSHPKMIEPLYATGFRFIIITQEEISRLLTS